MGTRLGSFTALVVLALAALVSATHDGPIWETGSVAGERSPDSSDGDPAPPRDGSATAPDRPEADQRPSVDDSPVTAPAAVLVLVLLVGAVVAVLVAVGLRLVLVRRRRLTGDRPPRAGATPDPDGDPDEAEDERPEQSLDHALADLAAGEPRNAIVAMWQHLERLLLNDRFDHHPADTPSEYAARARASYRLDESSLDELTALYREARFSRHPITERHRDRARACLIRLRDDLWERVP